MSETVLVVVGSLTAEHRHGVASGGRLANALRSVGRHVDVMLATDTPAIVERLVVDAPQLVVPVGFGPPSGDGVLHATCRMLNIPCAGPSAPAGTLMQDKANLSHVVTGLFPPDYGVRAPIGITITRNVRSATWISALSSLVFPLVVKPAFSGSSEGLSVHCDTDEVVRAVQRLLAAEGKVLVQQLEQDLLVEISSTVLDVADGRRFLPIVGIDHAGADVLGVEEKFGLSAVGRHHIPAELPSQVELRVFNVLDALHNAVGAVGLTHTDMLVLTSGELVVLEMNGIPSLAENSIACGAARAAGMSFTELAVAYADSAYLPRAEPAVWGTPNRWAPEQLDGRRTDQTYEL